MAQAKLRKVFCLAALTVCCATVFGEESRTVEQAVAMAEENASELAIQRLAVLKAGAAVDEAKAQLGPSIKIQGSGSALSNPTEGFKIEKGAFGYAPTPQSAAPVALPDQDYVLLPDAEHTYFRVSTTLTQLVFTWGKVKNAIAAAAAGLTVAEHEYDSKAIDIRRQAQNAYFGAAFAESTADALSRAAEIAEDLERDRKNAFQEGIITQADVLEATSRTAQLLTQLASTREAELTARSALNILTGGDWDEVSFADEYRRELPEMDEIELISEVTARSPERAVLLGRLAQAEALLAIEKGSRTFRPDISLNVSLDISGQRVPIIGANWRESWDTNLIVTLGTSVTALDSGASQSSIKQAEYTVDMARLGIKALDQGIQAQVRGYIESATAAWHEINQAEAEIDLAHEQEKNAKASFDNDLITRTEYLAAMLGTIFAEIEVQRALLTYELALIELESAVGLSLVDR